MNKAGTQRIETQRLILRRFVIEDYEAMYTNWCCDPEVAKYLTWPAHPNADVTRSILEEWIPLYNNGDYFNWVMELKETRTIVGNISVVKIREDIESALIGYCMSRSYWGQGLMPEALRAVMDYLFDVVGMNRVEACHDINNPKSGRVMDKAGMKYEGTLREAGRNNQGIIDEVWYALVRSQRDFREELHIELQDCEWPESTIDHTRNIARAVAVDEEGFFYFVKTERVDEFGNATHIETSGGGMEEGEDPEHTVLRELKEELGAEAEVICKLGQVSDYYNVIGRHNLTNYFLCRIKNLGARALTEDEQDRFHLETVKLTYDEAMKEYTDNRTSRIGRLIANREVPILRHAKEVLDRKGA